MNLSVVLNSDLINLDVLCFTEHWLMENQMRVVNIDHFKLVSNFSIFSSKHWGSSIIVQNNHKLKNKLLERVRKWKRFWNDYSRIYGF